MSEDISWRECNIHKDVENTKKLLLHNNDGRDDPVLQHEGTYDDDDTIEMKKMNQSVTNARISTNTKTPQEEEEEEEDKDFVFQLFAKNDGFETFEYKLPLPLQFSLPLPVPPNRDESERKTSSLHLQLRGQEEIHNSTGLSMWLGSELLCHYILQQPDKVRHKTVLELGAGMGLCGIVAYHIGARDVLMTDGDIHVLDNMRYNVEQNVPPESYFHSNLCQKANIEGTSHGLCVEEDMNKQTKNIPTSISCPQLIWGQRIDEFQNKYGKANVILAADCIYMTQSVDPLWQTIDQLLQTSSSDDDEEQDQESIVLYTNRSSSSARAPLEMIFETAAKYGFGDYTKTYLSFDTCAVGDESVISGHVYEFRRRIC